ncbi:hypothetical protein IEO21_07850 [Rhodonia placenta]|uniref:Uncharacterized protein n=1 Tax=Rhodonia placenta TaxID=104341 RepID=A0A8H7NXJ2_9APHY|nr:hypothetical protein IEO21_07850 [Postia placenta]
MSTTASSSAVRRPTTKRAYHTWHSKATEQPRSHFEDFLLEIGASSQAQHLCCMPRQVGTDRPLRGHRRMTTSVETRRQSSDNARDLSPNKGSRVPMRGRRREPIVISTASYAGHRTPHPLMLHALEVGGATSLFKVEASSAVNFQTYDAVDSYFSVDISHSSLRSLLGPDAHDEQQLPLPRRDVYDDALFLPRFVFHCSLIGGTGDSQKSLASPSGNSTELGRPRACFEIQGPSPVRDLQKTRLELPELFSMRRNVVFKGMQAEGKRGIKAQAHSRRLCQISQQQPPSSPMSTTVTCVSEVPTLRLIAVDPLESNNTAADTRRTPPAPNAVRVDLPGDNHARAALLRGALQKAGVIAGADGSVLRVSSTHSRSQSDAVVGYTRLRTGGREGRAFRRQRVASSVDLQGRRTRDTYRPGVPPALSTVLPLPKPAPAVLHTSQDDLELLGSFTPTSSPRRSLRSLLAAEQPRTYPSQIPPHPSDSGAYDAASNGDQAPSRAWPPSRHLSSLPSICRTPSSYSGSDYFSSVPSSAGPPTPARETSPPPTLNHKALHPVLESLEDASKISVQTRCANCTKKGANFPSCPRCGEMWCSRECRLQSSGGKKHTCRKAQ